MDLVVILTDVVMDIVVILTDVGRPLVGLLTGNINFKLTCPGDPQRASLHFQHYRFILLDP